MVSGNCGNTQVEINGGKINYPVSGGSARLQENEEGFVTGNVEITVNGGEMGMIYAGELQETRSAVNGTATITINDGTAAGIVCGGTDSTAVDVAGGTVNGSIDGKDTVKGASLNVASGAIVTGEVSDVDVTVNGEEDGADGDGTAR